MATLQEQARALGDPTRHDVFRYMVDAGRPVDVSGLTDHFALNHNAIRQHLAKLVAAGLVIEEKAPSSGRGRPRLLYRVDPTADSRWGVTGPYERLALWLAEIVRTGDTAVEVGRRVGREQSATAPQTSDPVGFLLEQMARHGFDPAARRRGTNVDLTLRTCPFESTALVAPDTVCDLHLGIAYGVAEAIEGLEVRELIPKDPRGAGCRLRCQVTDERDGDHTSRT